MSDALFDRYREALRAGHVAVMRGRLEDAAASYREAGELARDRAVPRTALGSVELRLGQPERALATFDEAIALVPTDDAALLGRAQALVVLRRPAEAAATFDLLADARHAAGKPVDACEALRRSLDIEPTVARRERYQELAQEVQVATGGGKAEPPLDRVAVVPEVASRRQVPADKPSLPPPTRADIGESTDAAAAPPAGTEEPAPAAAPPTPGEPAPAGAPPAVLPAAPPAAPVPVADGDALLLAAEEAASRGDAHGAVAAAMAAARAFRAAGHPIAALDACVGGLRSGPDDVNLHLLIAELAFERGAAGPAADTYRNLLRLIEIDGDAAARDRVLVAARAVFPDDPRFPSA